MLFTPLSGNVTGARLRCVITARDADTVTDAYAHAVADANALAHA
jgi:hypothetical protein